MSYYARFRELRRTMDGTKECEIFLLENFILRSSCSERSRILLIPITVYFYLLLVACFVCFFYQFFGCILVLSSIVKVLPNFSIKNFGGIAFGTPKLEERRRLNMPASSVLRYTQDFGGPTRERWSIEYIWSWYMASRQCTHQTNRWSSIENARWKSAGTIVVDPCARCPFALDQ